MKILFVCTGNTCRSPMAEGLFKQMLKNNNILNISVSSAGISVFPGEHANEKAIKALKEKGIDLRDHRAKQVYEEIHEADLILTMTLGHKKVLGEYFKDIEKLSTRLYTLKEFASKIAGEEVSAYDIGDPYGMTYEAYKRSRDEIEKELEKIIYNINKLEEI